MTASEIRDSIIAQVRAFPAIARPNTLVVGQRHFYEMQSDKEFHKYFSFNELTQPTHYMGLRFIIACDHDVTVLYKP
jgi:hypothetical protein